MCHSLVHNAVINLIILTYIQPRLPPSPEVYTGRYRDQYRIYTYHTEQYGDEIVLTGPLHIIATISYYDDLLFQAKLPPLLPCLSYEIIAINNQWLYLDEIDKDGKSPGFTFPGMFRLVKFNRF